MRFVFRCDASLDIGTGHVMRCLTLAHRLVTAGDNCQFICRKIPGNLISHIEYSGFPVISLPAEMNPKDFGDGTFNEVTSDAFSLGYGLNSDAELTLQLIADMPVDWVVVDHYSIDIRWERHIRPSCRRLMVIDDLANRLHDCDLLVDPNLGRNVSQYISLVPTYCTVLAGPLYALLRADFSKLRNRSLERRENAKLENILIFMGGIDRPNATSLVLNALNNCELPVDISVTVVMGSNAPWLEEVRCLALQMRYPVAIHVNTESMALLMGNCDLVIGAAGGASWERCCLGVPSLIVVLADNQWSGALALEHSGSARLIKDVNTISSMLPPILVELQMPSILRQLSKSSASVTDGLGVERVHDAILNCSE